jgi:hypothetical protein
LKKIEGTIDLIGEEIKKEVNINDLMSNALLQDLKEELQNETSAAKATEKDVSDAITDLEKGKEDLENYLEVLTGHKKKAEDTDPRHLLDKQQDIDVVHEVAEKIRGLQFRVTHDTDVLKEALKDAEATAKKAKEVVAEYLTTTTTTTLGLECKCFHCGSNEAFNSADVCGPASDACSATSPDNGGCWTNRNDDPGCVCSTETLIVGCQCYHCGGSSEFNNADVCGPASGTCGPISADNGGCWNNVVGATCQCDEWQTTG